MPLTTIPKPQQREAVALLLKAIDDSGLTYRDFSESVLVRDERVVRRWINGHTTIPRVVRVFLQAWHNKHTPRSDSK